MRALKRIRLCGERGGVGWGPALAMVVREGHSGALFRGWELNDEKQADHHAEVWGECRWTEEYRCKGPEARGSDEGKWVWSVVNKGANRERLLEPDHPRLNLVGDGKKSGFYLNVMNEKPLEGFKQGVTWCDLGRCQVAGLRSEASERQ